MADLLDIAPSLMREAVTVSDGKQIDVRLLNASDVAGLLARFPSLFPLLIGGVIAAGCDHLCDEKAEALAGSFSIEDQVKLLDSILRLTFPNGPRPVMQALEGIVATLLRGAEASKVVKMPSKPSPSPSPPLSAEASRQAMS